MDDIQRRFRQVNRYAGKNGYVTGFPNFEQADYNDGRGLIYGAVLIKPGSYVEYRDVALVTLDSFEPASPPPVQLPITVAVGKTAIPGEGYMYINRAVLSASGRFDA